MKTIRTFVTMACAVLVFSTAAASPTSFGDNPKPCRMSGLSALLYVDLMQMQKTDPSLKNISREMQDRYGMRVINSELYVGAFATVTEEQRGNAIELGILFNGKRILPYSTVNIPVKRYVDFLNSGIAKYVEIGEKNVPMMDSARYFTNTNQVHRGYNMPKGYTGKGVVVGIIDIGFDYTHRNFWDSTETVYRVKRVWDQNASSGTPPAGFNYGNLMTTQTQILSEVYSHSNQTHGTHVAGMAVGGGTSQTAYKKYKGMAPESDIVLVATSMYSNDILDGLMYILDYADSVGKPCVVNMSLGSHVGPHDGTDYNELYVDYLFENYYTKGAALLVSAGNEGSDNLHLSHSYSGRTPSMSTFAVKSDGSNKLTGVVDIWGSVGGSFQVKVGVVDSTTSVSTLSSYTYPLTLSSQNSENGVSDFSLGNSGYVSYYVEDSAYGNNKPHVYLYFNGANLSGRQCFIITVTPNSGTVHMWNNSGVFIAGAAGEAGNSNYTTNNRASGNTSIMVASYNNKVSWTSYAGSSYNFCSRYTIGGRSYFSSIGPGLNPNQNKPEISAPGAFVNSSYNCYDSRYTTSNAYITGVQTNGNGSCWWGMMQGTSMACPAATGIVALWMEAYPELSYAQVKELMRTTSISDNLTGTIPANGSPYWGWGKINAYAGIQKILSNIPAKPVITPAADTFVCAGQNITVSAPAGYMHYQWNTGDTTRSITVNSSGRFCVRVDSVGGYFSPWSDTIAVAVRQILGTTISADTSICRGQSVALIVSGGSSHLWSTGDTTTSITVMPAATTTYTVVSSAPNYCSKTDNVTVTVKRIVNPVITNDTHVCPFVPVTLTAGGGDSYYWLNPAQQTTQSVTVAPPLTTTYMVRIDSAGLCPAFDSVTVYTYPMPHVEIAGDTGDVPNYSATLTATGAQTYLWNTGDTTASITVSPVVPTRYSVVGTTQYGCVDSASTTVKCLETSIATAGEMQFRVYPNPVSPKSQLTVESAGMETITVYNMLGKTIAQINANGATGVEIDVKDFVQGVYVICVTDTKGRSGRKAFVVR